MSNAVLQSNPLSSRPGFLRRFAGARRAATGVEFALLAPLVAGSEAVPRTLWLRLNGIWVVFYGLLGALNLWVAYSLTERAWVNFKVFGLTAAFMAFAIAQALWLAARTETLTA